MHIIHLPLGKVCQCWASRSEDPDCTQKLGNAVIRLYRQRVADGFIFINTWDHSAIQEKASFQGRTTFDNNPNTKASTPYQKEVQIYLFKAEIWIRITTTSQTTWSKEGKLQVQETGRHSSQQLSEGMLACVCVRACAQKCPFCLTFSQSKMYSFCVVSIQLC